MSIHRPDIVSPVDDGGMFSTEFIEQTGLTARMLAGAPSLLELGILSHGLRRRSCNAVRYLFEETGDLFHSCTIESTVPELINLTHDKFSKIALVQSLSLSEMVYFDYSNDYFIFLGRQEDVDDVFHLDRDQMSNYFNDSLEVGLDEAHLKSVWAKYAPFM